MRMFFARRALFNHSKTYADGTTVAYTHTADGLPLRTTWARGAWRESEYDAARREIARRYSDPSLDCLFGRDVFGALVSASNAVAQTAILRDNPGMATNETHAIAPSLYDHIGIIVAVVDESGAPVADSAFAPNHRRR